MDFFSRNTGSWCTAQSQFGCSQDTAMVRVGHSPREPPHEKLLIRFISWAWKDISLWRVPQIRSCLASLLWELLMQHGCGELFTEIPSHWTGQKSDKRKSFPGDRSCGPPSFFAGVQNGQKVPGEGAASLLTQQDVTETTPCPDFSTACLPCRFWYLREWLHIKEVGSPPLHSSAHTETQCGKGRMWLQISLISARKQKEAGNVCVHKRVHTIKAARNMKKP